MIFFICFLLSFRISFSQYESSDTININPNQISYGLDKQFNIYGFNFLMNYLHKSSYGNFLFNQKYLGSAYISGNTILQDDEYIEIQYDYPINDYFSLLSSSNVILISNQGSSELNKLQRLNFLLGTRISFYENIFLDLQSGLEDNKQMTIDSKGSIFKINGIMAETDIENYLISANVKGEILSLDLDRINKDFQINTNLSTQYDEYSSLTANISYKALDRYNALRRDEQYMLENNLDFECSLEARSNNIFISDIYFSFALTEKVFGTVKLFFSNSNTNRFFSNYVKSDSRTSISQNRELLRATINPEFTYKSDGFRQFFGILYSYDTDINRVSQINSIEEQELSIYRNRAFDLDNMTSNLRLMSRTNYNISPKDTLHLSGMTSITRFDTPSDNNNSDRDEFLGLINFAYSKKLSNILSLRLDTELQLNHQVNLKSQRSSSNYWMRSIKFAPSIIVQTKNFFMRPQPYVLANYTVYDYEGFAPGIRSFSLRQIAYNDSIAIIFSNNTYLGTRIDLIYKETGTLFWNDFKETPINGNLKIFYKFFYGYYDINYNFAIGLRYFNLTQKNFRVTSYMNNDYKTESYAPEAIISANISDYATLKINAWYEFQRINDINKNEIPNIIINTIIKL